MDRSNITEETADKLRSRMRNCSCVMYLYSRHSQQSRWMTWELGYFDGQNGNVAVLPVVPANGALDFDREECLLFYPKVDFSRLNTPKPTIWGNRSRQLEGRHDLQVIRRLARRC